MCIRIARSRSSVILFFMVWLANVLLLISMAALRVAAAVPMVMVSATMVITRGGRRTACMLFILSGVEWSAATHHLLVV